MCAIPQLASAPLNNPSSQQRTGHFNISSGMSKPRHVFVLIINDANINVETANPFLYNTFSVSSNPRTLDNWYLVVGNGNEYPEIFRYSHHHQI